MSTDFDLYSDGGCLVNPGGIGACAFVLIDNSTGAITESSASYRATTNNRMEIMAVIDGLSRVPSGCSAAVYSDSQYVIKTMSGQFSRGKNLDLWERLDRVSAGKAIQWNWVRGHRGNLWNERCDEMTTAAMHSATPGCDVGYEYSQDHSPARVLNHEKTIHNGIREVIKIPPLFEGPEPEDWKKLKKERGISEKCARAVVSFYAAGVRSFSTYRALRTHGTDGYSFLRWDTLCEMVEEYVPKYIKKYIKEDKDAASAIRWHLRGMTLSDSIRKAMVDAEISRSVQKPSPPKSKKS